MDKWLKRKFNDDNSDNDNVRDQVNGPTPGTSKNTSCSKKYVVHRKYNDDFLKFGFTSTMENDIVVSECVICGFKLSNSAMVPSKLQRHLVTNLSPKDKSYFKRSLSSKIKQVKVFEKQVCVSEKAQVASYEIAELIAVNLKPHNLAEEIILPACRKIVKTIIGGSADIDICIVPLSNDTIHRRIKDMSENIEQNTAKTLANSNFALQVDETTDITGNAQLIAFVRFIHENDIINQFLCCRELPDFTTRKHIFQVISSYLEEIKVSWKSCIGICTDGAPAMTGHLKGFVAHVKELNKDILVTHCFLHREALVTKFLPSDLKIVLEQCVKMVNYIKSRPLKSRLFSKLCQAMEAKYESLLLHTELSQTYAQVDKPTIATSTTQTDENITKIKCPPLHLIQTLLSLSDPNASPSFPSVSTSSSTTQANLLSSISSIKPITQIESRLSQPISASAADPDNILNTCVSSLSTETCPVPTTSNKFAALSTEVPPSVPLPESAVTTFNS
ncbi:SCAN domain-containing protein 3 [Trichonephila clavipes]|nr:SCAN domain-containing protein 3 [Trichonephila clavipes]